MVFWDSVERYEYVEVIDSVTISSYAKNAENSLMISMIANLKYTCQQFLQIWYLEILIVWVIQGT